MAEGKKSFLLYCDLIHTVRKMPDEKAGQLLKHILEYVNDNNPETEDLLLQLVFEPIKQQLKRDLEKWSNISVTRSEIGRLAGIKSGEARRTKSNQNEPIGSETNQNEHVSDNVIVSDNVNDKENVKSKKEKDSFSDEKPILRNIFADVFLTWFFEKHQTRFGIMKKNKSGGEYEDMAKKDWVGIALIEKYCNEDFETQDLEKKQKYKPVDTFRAILVNYDKLPVFYQENRNPAFIASRISQIISLLKKPAKNVTKQDEVMASMGTAQQYSGEWESPMEKIKRETLAEIELKKLSSKVGDMTVGEIANKLKPSIQ